MSCPPPRAGGPPGPPLADALARGPLVLDGGLSNQLQAQGCDLSDELWSARLLVDDPEQIAAAHGAYVRAGAQVLITSSYQVSYEAFARRGAGREETDALLRRSVRLARTAAAGERPVWVAASVGPYGAVRSDGSEYRGRYGLSVAALADFHRPRVRALATAGPDVLALETVPDTAEAEAMLRAAADCPVPLWLSYTVDGNRTRAGQPLDEAFALAAENGRVIATGVNCCRPGDAEAAVRQAARITGKPVVVYPNSGEDWDPRLGAWRGPDAFDPALADTWRRAGARLIGGCCRVGPDRIADIARVLAGDRQRDPGRPTGLRPGER